MTLIKQTKRNNNKIYLLENDRWGKN